MLRTVSLILAGLTVFADILIVLSVIFFALKKFLPNGLVFRINQFMGGNKIAFSFIVSFTAMMGSLFFSEIAKFPPCVLCWWQRIFMYPQTILLLTALIRNEISITPYLKVINVAGLSLSAYHYLLQRLPVNPLIPCEVGGAVSCTKQYSLEFGYITIPLMAASAFLLNFLLLSFNKKVFMEPLIKKTRKSRQTASKK